VIPLEWLHAARERIEGLVKETPLTYDDALGVFFKWENHQITGSFKIRGAANKVLSLQDWERENGVTTCSAGNHGQGVALVAQRVGTTCEVYTSSHAVPIKIAAMEALGANVHLVDGDYVAAEKTAIKQAEQSGKVFISPYNDVQVIAGQGTLGLELQRQSDGLKGIQSIVVPVGGGGLLAGIGGSLESLTVKPRLIGAQSETSPYMHSLFNTGTQDGVIERDSLADGLAGEVDHQSITIPLVDYYADEIVLVTENEIRDAIIYVWKTHHQIIEGSAAVSVAAVLAKKVSTLPAIIIVTGGNIQPALHKSIIQGTGP
jgi:threonine dehydratase